MDNNINQLLVTDTVQYFLVPNGTYAQRENGELNSKIKYVLNNFVNYNDPSILSHSIKISSAIFPYSFYIINEYNNKLIINDVPIYIDYGNYNAYTLSDAINNAIKKLIVPIPNNTNSLMYINMNDTTGKFSLISTIQITIDAINSTINDVVGLSKTRNYHGVSSSVSSGVSSTLLYNGYQIDFDYQVNTSGTRNIYIKSNLQLENTDTLDGTNMTLKNIPVNVPPYGIIMYNNNENIETLIKTRTLDSLEIHIIDDNGNYVDFNNQNWTIVVEIKKTKLMNLKYEGFKLL